MVYKFTKLSRPRQNTIKLKISRNLSRKNANLAVKIAASQNSATICVKLAAENLSAKWLRV